MKITPLLLLALTPSAWAQCGASGVDLVVADVTSVNVFSNTGGVVALMPGIALCNYGSAPASWTAATADHPGIAFTLLRFHVDGGRGRFEAIGQSWVHHQSSALQQALCCACTPAGFGELGVGCSTTSSASGVGQQSQLGLRGTVDPQTGAFPWPLGNPPPGNSADRRLQVAAADLATPNARYFLEAQVISADDAASGQRANSASFREVVIGAGPTFLFAGPTTIGLPAIEMWPFLDANAVIATSTVPGEGGSLRLAHASTDIGGGFHAYEYALHDLDSHAGVRSFSVPIPPGVAVRGVDFRGPATHSGDPRDDAPWTASLANGRLTWSTADFATDPLANGLSFGTTFTFRFEASSPPVAAPVELARFRPGAPDSWTVAGRGPSGIGADAFCFGDGSGTACPCANASAVGAGAGCLNSLGSGGRLARGGVSSIANDSFALFGTGMPNSSALYFQGTSTSAGGAGTVFGDGLRCAAGTVVRLGTETNVGNASTHPGPGDVPISIAGAIVAGSTRTYQCWYRNAAAFCTTSTFNLTNGVATIWAP